MVAVAVGRDGGGCEGGGGGGLWGRGGRDSNPILRRVGQKLVSPDNVLYNLVRLL